MGGVRNGREPLLAERQLVALPSTYGRRAVRNVAAAAAAAVAAAWGVRATPGGGLLDPWACAAGSYILALFSFQNNFLEWPELDMKVVLLLTGAVGNLLLPNALHSRHLWEEAPAWRAAARVADAALAVAAYRHMVRGPRGCRPKAASLGGRVVVITGCNTGIGYEAAEALALGGALIVFACRSEDRARGAMQKLLARTQGDGVTESQLQFIQLDVSSLTSVRRFAYRLKQTRLQLHTLVLNAGIMLRTRALSEDGFEMTMASNHLGHFLLARLLVPALLETEALGDQPRVVVVGSNMCYMHDVFDFSEAVAVTDEAERREFLARPYSLFRAYGQSKLANLLCAQELARRLQRRGSRIPVSIVHPGEVLTEVMRDLHPAVLWLYRVFRPLCYLFFKNPSQGAVSTVHAAVAPHLATADGWARVAPQLTTGMYYIRLAPSRGNEVACDEVTAARLWKVCEDLTGEAPEV